MDFLQSFWVRLGPSHSSCKFLRLFFFAVFLHSSRLVFVSYFMLIPVFVILLFSVTVFQPTFWWNKFLWKKPVKSVCDFTSVNLTNKMLFIVDPALTDFDYTRLCERTCVMIQGLSMER